MTTTTLTNKLEERWLRIATRFKRVGGCLVWQGAKSSAGYGQVRINYICLYTHRIAYETFKGQIPPGFTIDHLCRNRACADPEHLEAVTDTENKRRGIAGKVNRARLLSAPACRRGHPLNGDNVRHYGPGLTYRACRQCERERAREYRRVASCK